ncbi:unnamed protein product [Camellia sinensis]
MFLNLGAKMVSNNQLFHLFLFLCFFQITCLHAQLCTQEQTSALLQFKQQFSFNKSASDANCDYGGILSYPKMESWKEGSDCCSWDGVECENNTSQVIGLDLSCSWLNGTIHPNTTIFYYFPHLQSLNLAFNDFGHIPASLANLTMLEWLDLSSNKLNGEIPQQLRNLKFLEVLNLSQNQLIGPIPQGNQFDTFLNDSYIDNLALCGPPLLNACNPRTPQPPPLKFQQEDNTSSGFNWEVILLGYICGLVWGLVMGYFMFSRGKPQWLVRIIEGEQNKSGKRFKKRSHRIRAR